MLSAFALNRVENEWPKRARGALTGPPPQNPPAGRDEGGNDEEDHGEGQALDRAAAFPWPERPWRQRTAELGWSRFYLVAVAKDSQRDRLYRL